MLIKQPFFLYSSASKGTLNIFLGNSCLVQAPANIKSSFYKENLKHLYNCYLSD